MKNVQNQFSVFGILCIAAVGCAGTHAEEVRDARFERIEAKTEVKTERADNRGEQREEATAKSYDAREERAENSERPGEDAHERLIELSRERAEFRADIQTRMEKLSIRINAEHQKLQVLGDRAPMQTRTELQTVVSSTTCSSRMSRSCIRRPTGTGRPCGAISSVVRTCWTSACPT